ncbi:MAG: GxxExxY protein [Planctomycetaceae bacterium]|jgi:GxxExxY protein|nr:GxxExxY protein [Planctomycetaceae bacterium]
MDTKKYKHQELTEKIIQAFYCVYNELGFGFLESVYQNALYFELSSRGFKVETQKAIDVYYHDQPVGKYRADLIVNDLIILELKAVDYLVEEHEFQLINYLKATDKEVGLLLNFGMKPEIRRKVFDNNRKKHWHTEDADIGDLRR